MHDKRQQLCSMNPRHDLVNDFAPLSSKIPNAQSRESWLVRAQQKWHFLVFLAVASLEDPLRGLASRAGMQPRRVLTSAQPAGSLRLAHRAPSRCSSHRAPALVPCCGDAHAQPLRVHR